MPQYQWLIQFSSKSDVYTIFTSSFQCPFCPDTVICWSCLPAPDFIEKPGGTEYLRLCTPLRGGLPPCPRCNLHANGIYCRVFQKDFTSSRKCKTITITWQPSNHFRTRTTKKSDKKAPKKTAKKAIKLLYFILFCLTIFLFIDKMLLKQPREFNNAIY